MPARFGKCRARGRHSLSRNAASFPSQLLRELSTHTLPCALKRSVYVHDSRGAEQIQSDWARQPSQNYEQGRNLIDAATEAARQRLRPILMTSFAFLLGVMPLAIASGAGSGGQNAIGTGVAGGTITATALAIFLVPAFVVAVLRLREGMRRRAAEVSDLPAVQVSRD